jgi:hypothetical protein
VCWCLSIATAFIWMTFVFVAVPVHTALVRRRIICWAWNASALRQGPMYQSVGFFYEMTRDDHVRRTPYLLCSEYQLCSMTRDDNFLFSVPVLVPVFWTERSKMTYICVNAGVQQYSRVIMSNFNRTPMQDGPNRFVDEGLLPRKMSQFDNSCTFNLHRLQNIDSLSNTWRARESSMAVSVSLRDCIWKSGDSFHLW